jgi:hypothetical protein
MSIAAISNELATAQLVKNGHPKLGEPEAMHLAIVSANVNLAVCNCDGCEVIEAHDSVAARPEFLARRGIQHVDSRVRGAMNTVDRVEV